MPLSCGWNEAGAGLERHERGIHAIEERAGPAPAVQDQLD
jgi:hypothetical protein